jgi:protein-S-isoprenylcysteine O-methyltransferase Ste14
MWRGLAVAALVLWPLIPILWVQVHGRPRFWRRLGAFTYAVVLLEWLAVAVLVIVAQNLLLGEQFDLGILFVVGLVLMMLGVGLQVWASRLLGWRTLIGYLELRPVRGEGRIVVEGPFSITRHPTYLAHTLMLVGVFLMTGYTGTGVLALADFLSSYFVITGLEEKELLDRFGDDYRMYIKRVPKFFPLRLP